jgi:hypothetical protein
MNTNGLLFAVKEAGEDFEWYPSTKKMLEAVANDMRREFDASHQENERCFSILDIGAGNGNALKVLCDLTKNNGPKYAIEKSRTLIDALPDDVFVTGTDFHQQTLIDKKVDVVFCNPPYSEYEAWMKRIVSEANCRVIYMIVPQRWKNNKAITSMVERRAETPEVLSSMSFEDSEYRTARAQVDILKIKIKSYGYRGVNLKEDPFDIWFEANFKINAKSGEGSKYVEKQSKKEKIRTLVKGQNLIERLEELYRADFDKLLHIYRSLEGLDCELFKELGADLNKIQEGLKLRIEGLKTLYWEELFDNLESITSRLSSKSREKLLKKLMDNTHVDFTADNVYAVVVWAIKNANKYFDSQLIELYREFSYTDNIRNYKSNHRLIEDGWRYQRDHTHYSLDYRLVLERYRCFSQESYERCEYPNGLSRTIHDLLNDICTIGKNLGFQVKTTSFDFEWEPGKQNAFYTSDGDLFMEVRAYKKGTVHVKCDKEFMKRFNIEAGRLNGWIKSPTEATQEIGIAEAAELFGTNFKLKSIKLLESA